MEVNLTALAQNYRALRDHAAPAKVMAMIKANAYGHGLVSCAQRLTHEGCYSLGVAFIEEAIELRQAGISVPILVFGGIFGAQLKSYLDYGIDISASSISKLQQIEEAARTNGKRARVHLEIDSGIERTGVHHYSSTGLLEETLRCQHCDIVGIFSHFARADEEDLSFSKIQLERFLETLRFFEQRSLPMPIRHMANSAATLRLKESHLDMIRPGICLFGVYPEVHLQQYLPLIPVMSLKSSVVYFKVVKKGSGVSYGHRWIAPQDTRVVTVPIGYGDGYFRLLSNRSSVLIRGHRYPVVGNVCMDQLMVDIGPNGEAYNGDEVVLVGAQGNERISVNELADLVGTITHEILTATNLRVPRVYIG